MRFPWGFKKYGRLVDCNSFIRDIYTYYVRDQGDILRTIKVSYLFCGLIIATKSQEKKYCWIQHVHMFFFLLSQPVGIKKVLKILNHIFRIFMLG